MDPAYRRGRPQVWIAAPDQMENRDARLCHPRDLPKAAAFYDQVLGVLGAGRFMEEPDYFIAWGNSETGAGLGIAYPFDKEAATVGNGTMVALQGNSREQVDAVYAKALDLGGSDEGAPGQRSPGFHAASFRDLDGNKLNCCYMGE